MDKGKPASNPRQSWYAREVSLFSEFNLKFLANSEFNLLNDSMLKTKQDGGYLTAYVQKVISFPNQRYTCSRIFTINFKTHLDSKTSDLEMN